MKPRFFAAYLLTYAFFASVVFGMLVTGHFVHPAGASTPVRGLKPITDASSPADVDRHFKGNGYASGPATSLGMKDGTCWAYSNKSSWMVIKCFGGWRTP